MSNLPRGLNTQANHLIDVAAPMRAQQLLADQPKERTGMTRQLERFNGFGQAPGQETQYTQYTRDFAQDSSSAFDSRPPTNTTGKFGQGNTVPQSAFMGQTTRHAQMLS